MSKPQKQYWLKKQVAYMVIYIILEHEKIQYVYAEMYSYIVNTQILTVNSENPLLLGREGDSIGKRGTGGFAIYFFSGL